MRAVVLTGTGGPEQLVLEEVPEPVAADGQDVVEVKACGINFADVLVRLGRYPQMPERPAAARSLVTLCSPRLTVSTARWFACEHVHENRDRRQRDR